MRLLRKFHSRHLTLSRNAIYGTFHTKVLNGHTCHVYNPFKLPNLVPVKGLVGMGGSLHLAPIVQSPSVGRIRYIHCCYYCCTPTWAWLEHYITYSLHCAMWLIPNFSRSCMGCTLNHLAAGIYP